MFRRCFATLVTLLLALVLAPPAQAQTQSPSPTDDEGRMPPKIALVLDASGSMRETDVSGGSRMDAAKEASNAMVEDLDDDVDLGVIAYGSEVADDNPENITRGCRDIEVLLPVEALDRERATQEIAGLEATGYTPIGNSLKRASDELGEDGPRSIVLVSDGIDTCAPPDVCEVAEGLASDGVDLTIHTVGFKVDDEAAGELECIAEAGGGTYSSAEDTEELSTTLSGLAQRVGQGYEAGGTEITLGEDRSSGQYLGEGAYQTQMDGPAGSDDAGTPGWFKLNVPEGYRAHVAATVVTPALEEAEAGDSGWFNTSIDAENTTCNHTASSRWEATSAGSDAPSASVLSLTPKDGCDPDAWNFQVVRGGTDYQDELPVELIIGLEPIPDEEDLGPEDTRRQDDRNADVPGLDEDYPVTQQAGGLSYGTATEIEPGTYSGSLVPGETRFYRIPMEWGQRPVAEVVFNEKQAENSRRVKVETATPMRTATGVQMGSSLTNSETTQLNDSAYYPMPNPGSARFQREAAYIGDWYVMVTLDGNADNGKASVEEEYELTVVRDGDQVDGSDWTVPGHDGPDPSDEPIAPLTGASADPSASHQGETGSEIDESSGGSGSGGDSGTGDDSGDSQEAQATSSREVFGLSLPVAIGAAVVLGLVVVTGAVVVVVALARRNRRP